MALTEGWTVEKEIRFIEAQLRHARLDLKDNQDEIDYWEKNLAKAKLRKQKARG